MADKMIFVCGATGRQGGAVARALLGAKWQVRGLTRDPSRREARELQRLGAEMVRGDMNDREDLEQYIQGCYGVFSVQNFWEAGAEEEVRQGCLVADVAKDLRVQHLVYSSVGGAERHSGLSHFESKWEIEQYIGDLRVPASILRPVFFYDNYAGPPLSDSINAGTLSVPMPADRPLQMVATEDIGGFAELCFSRPKEFIGKAIELAGDEMTMPQVAEAFTEVLGRPIRFSEMPLDDLAKASPEAADMYRWFVEHGYQADIASLRQLYPPLQDFRTWLRHSAFAERLTRAA